MSVQPKRRTSSQKRRRASHFALRKANLLKCASCGESALAHHACPKCGEYRKANTRHPEQRSP